MATIALQAPIDPPAAAGSPHAARETWGAALRDRILPGSFMTVLAVLKLGRVAGAIGGEHHHVDAEPVRLYASLLHETLAAVFLLSVAALFLARHAPARKLTGVVPRTAALLGAYVTTGLALLPAADVPVWTLLLASTLLISGMACTVVTVLFLGRSFSILPEARVLVTRGPYRFMRHPLYAAEMVAFLGLALFAVSPLAVALYGLYVVLTLWRVRFEEAVLQEVYPHYAAYRSETPAFVPGLRRWRWPHTPFASRS